MFKLLQCSIIFIENKKYKNRTTIASLFTKQFVKTIKTKKPLKQTKY